MMRHVFALCFGLVVLCSASQTRADEIPNDKLFEQGVASLDDGAYDKAIASFEALADRGFNHADAAYNRGLAYLARLRARAAQPGDLGRAAAAFEEVLMHRPGDADAEQALDIIRAEVARGKAQQGGLGHIQSRPSLGRALVELTSETVWAILALVSSAILSLGLVLRRLPRGPVHLAGVIATSVAAVGLGLFAPIAAAARHLRMTSEPAVVVVAGARLLNEQGVATHADPIPEAARVDAIGRKGGLVKIQYAGQEGWTYASNLRLISR